MPHVEVAAEIAEDPDTLWREVGSFRDVGKWHPMLASVDADGEQPGARRTAETHDGARQVELLDDVDPAARRYRYSMESTPLPVRDYVAEFRIDPAGSKASRVVWSSDFRVTSGDEAAGVEMIRGFLAAGLDELRRRYA